MEINIALKTSRRAVLFPCRRCFGGTAFPDYEGYSCINCGAKHDKDGELITPDVSGGQVTSGGHHWNSNKLV